MKGEAETLILAYGDARSVFMDIVGRRAAARPSKGNR
jgi:hypothetical protein